jgi:hypothetical protein
MVPEIKSHALIGGEALETYQPEDAENFNVTLRLLVGPKGQPGEESFDITICTPRSLAEEYAAHGFVVGRHRLVVSTYEPSLIMNTVTNLVTRCSGLAWTDVGPRLGRLALWEFEDYH